MKKSIGASLVAIVAAALLVSCNSSSENAESTSGPGPFSVVTGNGLFAYDMNDATLTRRTITETPVKGAAMVGSLSLAADNKSIIGVTPAFVVYVAQDKIWKTDVRQGSNLAMMQVSSASMANVCLGGSGGSRFETGGLFNSDATLASIAWTTGGGDSNCDTIDDNKRFRAFIADGADVSPQELPPIRGGQRLLFDANKISAGPTEILAIADKKLIRYDANYDNQTTVATATSSLVVMPWQSGFSLVPPSGFFVRIDNQLRWYSRGVGLSASLLDLADEDGLGEGSCDLSQCVFVRSTQSTGEVSLYRIGANGESPAQILAENIAKTGSSLAPVGEFFSTLWGVSANYALYATYTRTAGSLSLLNKVYRVSKTGGPPILILSGQFNRTERRQLNDTVIAYSTTAENGTTQLTIMREDGTVLQSLPGASLNGVALLKIASTDGVAKYENGLMAFTTNEVGVQTGAEGAILQTYDPATNTLGVIAGQLPVHASGKFFGWNNKLVFSPRITDPMSTSAIGQNDLFFVDLNTANSLRRLTDTTSISETVVY